MCIVWLHLWLRYWCVRTYFFCALHKRAHKNILFHSLFSIHDSLCELTTMFLLFFRWNQRRSKQKHLFFIIHHQQQYDACIQIKTTCSQASTLLRLKSSIFNSESSNTSFEHSAAVSIFGKKNFFMISSTFLPFHSSTTNRCFNIVIFSFEIITISRRKSSSINSLRWRLCALPSWTLPRRRGVKSTHLTYIDAFGHFSLVLEDTNLDTGLVWRYFL